MKHLRVVFPVLLAACGGSSLDGVDAGAPDSVDATVPDSVDASAPDGVDATMPDSIISTDVRYPDVDGDGFGDTANGVPIANAPATYIARGGDCDDNDASSHPGGVEVCDGADNDCDGGRDGTVAAPDRCTALVGRYAGTYTHHTDERIGTTIINQVDCSGAGSMTLQLGRNPALLGSFTCLYSGSLGGFSRNQSVTLTATVDLSGQVTGTIVHTFGEFGIRTFTVRGTQTSSGIALAGTGSWFPNPMSAVPWGVTFSFSATK